MGMGMATVLERVEKEVRLRHNEECLCTHQRIIGWRLSGALAMGLQWSDATEVFLWPHTYSVIE